MAPDMEFIEYAPNESTEGWPVTPTPVDDVGTEVGVTKVLLDEEPTLIASESVLAELDQMSTRKILLISLASVVAFAAILGSLWGMKRKGLLGGVEGQLAGVVQGWEGAVEYLRIQVKQDRDSLAERYDLGELEKLAADLPRLLTDDGQVSNFFIAAYFVRCNDTKEHTSRYQQVVRDYSAGQISKIEVEQELQTISRAIGAVIGIVSMSQQDLGAGVFCDASDEAHWGAILTAIKDYAEWSLGYSEGLLTNIDEPDKSEPLRQTATAALSTLKRVLEEKEVELPRGGKTVLQSGDLLF